MMIRWLHLSDVHEHKGDGHPRTRMYDNIIKEVKNSADKPDLVFLTGDLAFSGTKAEYDSLQAGFIEPLQKALPDALFFPVPGNHDLMRKRGTKPRLWIGDEDESRLFHAASPEGAQKRGDALFPRFNDYAEFEQGFAAWDNAQGHWLKSETGAAFWRGQIGDRSIAVVGLNTAWLCQDDHDWGTLTPGRGLLERALELAQEGGAPNLLFVLGHHPLEAMEYEKANDGKWLCLRLKQNHALYLHGHMHESETHNIGGRYANALAIQAPSAFHVADSKVWRNGIMWGEADVSHRKLYLQPLKWNDTHSQFKFDNEAGANEEIEDNHIFLNLPGANEEIDKETTDTKIKKSNFRPPVGWEVMNLENLQDLHKRLPDDDEIGYFLDGGLATWELILTENVQPRDIVNEIFIHFKNQLRSSGRPSVLLLTAAGGDGKSTAILHVAAKLLENPTPSWTCLRRRAEYEDMPTNIFIDLSKIENHGWIILIDDADIQARELLSAIKEISNRTDIHFLLAARLNDWSLSAPATKEWNKYSAFSNREIKGISSGEAHRIVKGWLLAAGNAALAEDNDHIIAEANKLIEKSKENKAQGGLLGALLLSRYDEKLTKRVRNMVNKLDDSAAYNGTSERDVYIMIAAMHAENQLYLTKRIVACLLKINEDDLQDNILRHLRQEAMLDGGGAYLLTRQRCIAEEAVKALEEDGEKPYGFMSKLAGAAVKDFKVNYTGDPNIRKWIFNLAHHFADQPGRKGVAQAVAQAVYDADTNDARSLTACAQIYRKTHDLAGAFRILLKANSNVIQDRPLLYEWGTVARALGEHALGVWLDARALADGPGEAENKTIKIALGSLGFAFERLHQSEGAPAFLTARAACGQFGLRLPELDIENTSNLQKHAAAGARAGIREMTPEAAVKAIRSAVIAATNLVEPKPETPERPEINPLHFEKLLGDPDGYRYSQLLRAVTARNDKPAKR